MATSRVTSLSGVLLSLNLGNKRPDKWLPYIKVNCTSKLDMAVGRHFKYASPGKGLEHVRLRSNILT